MDLLFSRSLPGVIIKSIASLRSVAGNVFQLARSLGVCKISQLHLCLILLVIIIMEICNISWFVFPSHIPSIVDLETNISFEMCVSCDLQALWHHAARSCGRFEIHLDWE